jgi:hypothetical protein
MTSSHFSVDKNVPINKDAVQKVKEAVTLPAHAPSTPDEFSVDKNVPINKDAVQKVKEAVTLPAHAPSTPDEFIEAKYWALGGTSWGVPTAKDPGRMWTFPTACICYDAANGQAWEIVGGIYQHWLALGGLAFGVPCTGELRAPDGVGRYNHLNNETASIYWTPDLGAHAVYGGIHERWTAMGRENSYLGYPTSDEEPAPGGGRRNTFQGGSIYWTPAAGAFDLSDQALPDPFHRRADINFSDSTAVGGWADIRLSADGTGVFSGHLHDSGALDYTGTVTCIVAIRSTRNAYVYEHKGSMHGTFTPGSRDDDWSEAVNGSAIAAAWTDLAAGSDCSFRTDINTAVDGWIETVKKYYPYVAAVVAVL